MSVVEVGKASAGAPGVPAFSFAAEAQAVRSLDCRWLFALYALIPFSLLFVVVDKFFLGGAIIARLPFNPEYWPLWTILFGLPHIVASLMTMADREYLNHYRKILLWPLLLFGGIGIAGYYGPQPLSQQLLFILVAFYTVYHVLAQQLGLTLMMMGVPPTPTYKLWKWCSILAAFGIYAIVLGRTHLGHISLGPFSLLQLLGYLSALMTATVVVCGIQLFRSARTKIGAWYLCGNVALVVSTFLFMEAGYVFFVILVPRIIHDISAFMVYVSHDTNRNRHEPRNYFYRMTRFTRLPPWLFLPAASIALAYSLTSNLHLVWVNIFIIAITFLHYYFEGFIWRGANPHRASVNFKR